MATPMLSPQNTLVITRGTSKTLQLTVARPDTTYYDLTGGKLVMTVKGSVYDDLPLVQKLTTNPAEGVITKPREGVVEFYLVPADTNGLPPKTYIFDVWLITASGDRYVVVPESQFVVNPGVTYLPT